MVEVVTDNRNRSVAEVRNAFSRGGGSLGESGCVAWQFDQRGVLSIDLGSHDPDEVGLYAIDAGADDVRVEDGAVEVLTVPSDLHSVRTALIDQGVTVTDAEIAMVPKNTIAVDSKDAGSTLRLIERLEDLDDVQKVYTNLEISEEALTEYAAH
jgi:YebC/PmpR family DNA-binding regulatory protein